MARARNARWAGLDSDSAEPEPNAKRKGRKWMQSSSEDMAQVDKRVWRALSIKMRYRGESMRKQMLLGVILFR
ncbi:hypothetical protein N7536_004875 [Penicillium majusculum]|nr:hypothetical protein N7536_004875 [Penicillium majusculum]